MRGNQRALSTIIQFHTDRALINPRTCQNRIVVIRAQGNKSPRIRQSIHLILQVQIREAIHINLGREDNDDAVPTKLDRFHFTPKAQFADAAILMVVPDHDFVGGEAGVAATADEGEEVRAKEHFDDADPAVGEDATEGLPVGFDVVDAVWRKWGVWEGMVGVEWSGF